MKNKINYIIIAFLLFISVDSVGAIERVCVTCGKDALEIPALLPTFVSSLITLVQIFVPIVLIVTGIVRYIKAVTSGEDKAISDTNRSFIRSILTAIAIFFIVAIVRFVFNIVDNAGGENTTSCVSCFVNGRCDTATCKLRDGAQTVVKDCAVLDKDECKNRTDCYVGESGNCYSKGTGSSSSSDSYENNPDACKYRGVSTCKNECRWNGSSCEDNPSYTPSSSSTSSTSSSSSSSSTSSNNNSTKTTLPSGCYYVNGAYKWYNNDFNVSSASSSKYISIKANDKDECNNPPGAHWKTKTECENAGFNWLDDVGICIMQ